MADLLIRIKRAVLAGNVVFTVKAELEMEFDNLLRQDVIEAILYATSIYKSIRSKNLRTRNRREYLHIIRGSNLQGTVVYTKGKLVAQAGVDTYYVLVSAKRAL